MNSEFFICCKKKLLLFKINDPTGNSYELRGNLIGSNQAVNSLDFDSTGTLILGTSNDFASRVWGIGDHRLKVSEKIFLIFQNYFSLFQFFVLIFSCTNYFFKRNEKSLQKFSFKSAKKYNNFNFFPPSNFCVNTFIVSSHDANEPWTYFSYRFIKNIVK